MSRPAALGILIVVSLSWSAALATAPVAASPRLSALSYAAGSFICHQQPERSFHYREAKLPVCARCAGLYAGGVAGVLLWTGLAGLGPTTGARARRFTKTSVVRRLLIITALPTVVTVATAWLGWWDPGNTARAVLALPLGATIAAVITAVAAGDLR